MEASCQFHAPETLSSGKRSPPPFFLRENAWASKFVNISLSIWKTDLKSPNQLGHYIDWDVLKSVLATRYKNWAFRMVLVAPPLRLLIFIVGLVKSAGSVLRTITNATFYPTFVTVLMRFVSFCLYIRWFSANCFLTFWRRNYFFLILAHPVYYIKRE